MIFILINKKYGFDTSNLEKKLSFNKKTQTCEQLHFVDFRKPGLTKIAICFAIKFYFL